jgi:hypothetical protein
MKLLLITLSLLVLFISCKKEKEEIPQAENLLFESGVGTKWIYRTDTDDTLIWEITGAKSINGIECYELSKGPYPISKSYCYQEGTSVYIYADLIDLNSKCSCIPLEPSLSDDFDSLIIFSTPSLEYKINSPVDSLFFKTELRVTKEEGEYIVTEVPIEMKMIGSETITTPAGTFDCTILQDNQYKTYYVSSRGIIKTIFSLISNDYNISQTVELIAIE